MTSHAFQKQVRKFLTEQREARQSCDPVPTQLWSAVPSHRTFLRCPHSLMPVHLGDPSYFPSIDLSWARNFANPTSVRSSRLPPSAALPLLFSSSLAIFPRQSATLRSRSSNITSTNTKTQKTSSPVFLFLHVSTCRLVNFVVSPSLFRNWHPGLHLRCFLLPRARFPSFHAVP